MLIDNPNILFNTMRFFSIHLIVCLIFILFSHYCCGFAFFCLVRRADTIETKYLVHSRKKNDFTSFFSFFFIDITYIVFSLFFYSHMQLIDSVKCFGKCRNIRLSPLCSSIFLCCRTKHFYCNLMNLFTCTDCETVCG